MRVRASKFRINAQNIHLRLPKMKDRRAWTNLRRDSEDFLRPWEPRWSTEHLTARGFHNRVYWARKGYDADEVYACFIIRNSDQALLGAITLDNIRRGPSLSGGLGYWIGEDYARQGYMSEAIQAMVTYAFSVSGLSRIEAATLPENKASRGTLEKCGFKYEGVAQSYLQIDGRWRTHVLYARLRDDRRGPVEEGLE